MHVQEKYSTIYVSGLIGYVMVLNVMAIWTEPNHFHNYLDIRRQPTRSQEAKDVKRYGERLDEPRKMQHVARGPWLPWHRIKGS